MATADSVKTILITGASAGIGLTTAEYFQSKGWQVVATMRNPGAGADLAKLDRVLVTRLDVNNEATIQSAVAAAEERFGKIDVLVNNAGYGAYGILEATSLDSIRRQFETNVVGVLAVTKGVLPGFRKRRSGLIINISSIAGRLTIPFGALYCGSKFALEGVSEALRFELGAIGVRVKLVEPGFTKSKFSQAIEFNNDPSLTEYQGTIAQFMKAVQPLRENSSESITVAEAIYTAATDGTDQMRYPAGEDAREWMKERSRLGDAEFFAQMNKVFGQ